MSMSAVLKRPWGRGAARPGGWGRFPEGGRWRRWNRRFRAGLRHGEDLVEGLAAAELDDAGGGEAPKTETGLAAEFGDGGRRFAAPDVVLRRLVNSVRAARREAGGFDAADEGEVILPLVPMRRLIAESRPSRRDGDLIVGAEDIAGGAVGRSPRITGPGKRDIERS